MKYAVFSIKPRRKCQWNTNGWFVGTDQQFPIQRTIQFSNANRIHYKLSYPNKLLRTGSKGNTANTRRCRVFQAKHLCLHTKHPFRRSPRGATLLLRTLRQVEEGVAQCHSPGDWEQYGTLDCWSSKVKRAVVVVLTICAPTKSKGPKRDPTCHRSLLNRQSASDVGSALAISAFPAILSSLHSTQLSA
jgi:hypothetical protein